ncbi:MAG TPA: hypothetical protein PK373_08335, partial [Sedimentisphaerales bacterium]|nr:hypothetical protein [Sedimentisphaerales bacterium]
IVQYELSDQPIFVFFFCDSLRTFKCPHCGGSESLSAPGSARLFPHPVHTDLQTLLDCGPAEMLGIG